MTTNVFRDVLTNLHRSTHAIVVFALVQNVVDAAEDVLSGGEEHTLLHFALATRTTAAYLFSDRTREWNHIKYVTTKKLMTDESAADVSKPVTRRNYIIMSYTLVIHSSGKRALEGDHVHEEEKNVSPLCSARTGHRNNRPSDPSPRVSTANTRAPVQEALRTIIMLVFFFLPPLLRLTPFRLKPIGLRCTDKWHETRTLAEGPHYALWYITPKWYPLL